MAAPASAQFWQCVGFARMISGINIHGNAHTWWSQAAGQYQRGKTPVVGAVLAFKSIPGMPLGHVAVVSRIVSDREILLDHANWSRPGRIEHGVRAVDVSEAGDWSRVRVWFAPIGDLGTRVNAAYGFIYPGTAPAIAAPVQYAALDRPHYTLPSDVIQLAALER